MPHLFTSPGHGTFSPEGKVNASQAEADVINAETTAKELAFWATKPERFEPAYYDFKGERSGKPYERSFYPTLWRNDETTGDVLSAIVTTWTGKRLGTIISAHVYAHNFGARMVSMRVKGSNGATYYGRASWDNGTVIRLRKVKD